jgi:hypothetical protein
MPYGRPPLGLGEASLSWSETRFAKSCSSHARQVRLHCGTGSQSEHPLSTTASMTSPDAPRGVRFR